MTGLVALCYVLYFIDTYFVEKQPLAPSARRSEATPWNAIMGFLVIGIPCLWFTIRGRFSADEPLDEVADATKEADEPRPPEKLG